MYRIGDEGGLFGAEGLFFLRIKELTFQHAGKHGVNGVATLGEQTANACRCAGLAAVGQYDPVRTDP